MPELDRVLPFFTRKDLAFDQRAVFALRVQTKSATTTTIRIRGLTKEGQFVFRHSVSATASTNSTDFRIPDVPIMVSVFDASTDFEQGDCYVAVQLLINGDIVADLVSGWIYQLKGLSWPFHSSGDLIPGRGQFGGFSSSNPAAGSEISFTSPTLRQLRLLALRFTLVTSSTAANRRVHVAIGTAGATVDCISSVDQTASQTINYTVAPFGALPTASNDNDILINMPPEMWLDAGDSITTVTTNIQAGDDFGVLSVFAERFFSFLTV